MTLLVRDFRTIGVPICRDTETCAQVAARLAGAPVVVALDADGLSVETIGRRLAEAI